MKKLLRYMQMHKIGCMCFVLFTLIYFLLFVLYALPAQSVLYGAALCIFAGIFFFVPDFLRDCRKQEQLSRLRHEVGITLEHLPPAACEMEQRYQELLRELFALKQQYIDQSNRQYQDLLEYYTIWVHQIKTPIAAIGLLLQREDTSLTREVRQELGRVEQYVEMVLAVLRLNSDSTDYVIREYDLDAMLKQVLRKHASWFIGRKIQLRYQPLCCKVITDEKWLVFVLEQVLSNALKYTKSGSICITLEEPKILCITDTGIGIAPDDLPRIFEKGYTGYNGRRDKKASGIGLYLCRRILDRLGHRITAESAIGRGTTVRIDLNQQGLEVE